MVFYSIEIKLVVLIFLEGIRHLVCYFALKYCHLGFSENDFGSVPGIHSKKCGLDSRATENRTEQKMMRYLCLCRFVLFLYTAQMSFRRTNLISFSRSYETIGRESNASPSYFIVFSLIFILLVFKVEREGTIHIKTAM